MKKTTLLSLLLLAFQIAFSQISPLKNINPGEEPSLATEQGAMAKMGDALFFSAKTAQNGTELWKTDGTSTGTVMVKDIYPGATGSAPDHFYVVGDHLIFTANDGTVGRELWVTDGTEAGTVLLADVRPGTSSAFSTFFLTLGLRDFYVFQNELYFRAFTDADGLELYKSDGTPAGTSMIKSIGSGFNDGCQGDFTELNGELYFVGFTTTNGGEIWKTDGTEAGTVQVTTTLPQTPTDLTALGNILIFVVDDGASGPELWKSDGTNAGTALLKNTDTTDGSGGLSHQIGSAERRFFVSGTKAYFSVIDAQYDSQVWVTDGTVAGTIKLKSTGTSGCAPGNFVQLGNIVLFTGCGFFEDKVWRTIGTAPSTVAIETYEGNSFAEPSNFRLLHVHDGKLWYGGDGGGGPILYQTNGSPLQADAVDASFIEFYREPQRFFSFGNKMVFWAQTLTTGIGNLEPFVYKTTLTLSGTASAVSCHGGNDGAINVQTSGSAPFTTSWNSATVAGLNPTGLSAGSYTVTVTDQSGAQGTATFLIMEPSELTLLLDATPQIGTEQNGSATANPSGGTPPYQYVWNSIPPQTGQTANGLTGNFSYSCTITDANGCTLASEVFVDFMVGMNDPAAAYNISLAPNPATQQISVLWKNPIVGSTKTYRLFDSQGKLVGIFKNPGNDIISLEGLPNGVFMLEILLDQADYGKFRFIKNQN